MRKLLNTVVIFTFYFFLASTAHVFGQTLGDWEWHYPSPYGNQLTSVTFLNDDLGWAGGSGGLIKRTTDGGDSWEMRQLGTLNSVSAIEFVNENTGWAIVSSGEIYTTSDAGITWNLQYTVSHGSLNAMHFIDEQTGWIAGGSGNLYKTENGGDSWQEIEIDVETSGFASVTYNSITFDQAGNGLLVGRISSNNNITLRTNDGGETWEDSFSTTTYRAVQFVDDQIAWKVGEDSIVRKTTDAGETWSNHSVTESTRDLWYMHFVDESTGWVMSNRGNLYKTIDSGENWIDQSLTGDYNAVFALNSDKAWVAGDLGAFKETTDGGSTWQSDYQTLTNRNIRSVQLTSDNSGWLLTSDFMQSVVYNTEDGGDTWNQVEISAGDFFRTIHFSSNENGWIAGNSGTIYATSDNGNTWGEQNSDTDEHLDVIYAADDNHVWAAGRNGVIVHSSDNGQNWSAQESCTDENLHSITFANSSLGWIAGDDGTICKTEDGGANWTGLNTGVGWNLYDIDHLDEDIAWAVGARGTVLKTTDGGANWEFISHQNNFNTMTSLHMIDENSAWVTDSDGLLSYTKNGGHTWVRSLTRSDSRLNHIHFTESGTGWAAGHDGALLKFNTADQPGTPVLIEPSASSGPIPADEVVFSWFPVFNSESYQIQVATDNDFSNVVLDESEIGTSSFSPQSDLPTGTLYWRVRTHYDESKSEWSPANIYHSEEGDATSIAGYESDLLPGEIRLKPNYPNPFNPTTNIRFELGHGTEIALQVYDVTGRLVAVLADGYHERGVHEATFDGSRLASGTYLYRLQASGQVITQKMLLIQ